MDIDIAVEKLEIQLLDLRRGLERNCEVNCRNLVFSDQRQDIVKATQEIQAPGRFSGVRVLPWAGHGAGNRLCYPWVAVYAVEDLIGDFTATDDQGLAGMVVRLRGTFQDAYRKVQHALSQNPPEKDDA